MKKQISTKTKYPIWVTKETKAKRFIDLFRKENKIVNLKVTLDFEDDVWIWSECVITKRVLWWNVETIHKQVVLLLREERAEFFQGLPKELIKFVEANWLNNFDKEKSPRWIRRTKDTTKDWNLHLKNY